MTLKATHEGKGKLFLDCIQVISRMKHRKSRMKHRKLGNKAEGKAVYGGKSVFQEGGEAGATNSR